MKNQQPENREETKQDVPAENIENAAENKPADQPVVENPRDETEKMKTELAAVNDKFLRLYSEFDNYKKRASRERIEFTKMAGSDVIISMLPVLDDFERALKSMSENPDMESAREGINLIYTKFKNTLQLRGLTEMKSSGETFDAEIHEAVAMAPSPSEDMKGKVLEELEKGYSLNGKVIRHAKVLVGS